MDKLKKAWADLQYAEAVLESEKSTIEDLMAAANMMFESLESIQREVGPEVFRKAESMRDLVAAVSQRAKL